MESEHLPEDMIVEILLRLEVKPLLRFRCVSKGWRSIVSSPKFAKSHYKSASELETLSHRLLIFDSSSSSGLESIDFKKPSFLDDAPPRKLTFPPFNLSLQAVDIVGACNGMVCIVIVLNDSRRPDRFIRYDKLHIWNPSTGKFRKLPRPGFWGVNSSRMLHCGFGYVSATDDYKVLVCPQVHNTIENISNYKDRPMPMEIFSCRKNSWTRVESPPHEFSSWYSHAKQRGTLMNEALHWIECMPEPYSPDPYSPSPLKGRYVILALDLSKQTFGQISLPFSDAYSSYVGVVCGGCLCVSSFEREDKVYAPYFMDSNVYVQLWAMMEYGVAESWNKLFRVKTIDGQLERPIFCRDGGLVMLEFRNCDSRDFISFDHRGEEKHDKVAVCSSRYIFEENRSDMIEYDESLLWLPDRRKWKAQTQQ